MTLSVLLSLMAVIAVVLCARVLFVEYPASAVDATRTELFELRDELFKLAQNGSVSFEHPGYRAARDILNGMIRYAHDASVLHILCTSGFASKDVKRLRKAVNASIQRDINSLPRTAKAPVKALLARAAEALSRLVVFRSVGLSCVFAAYVAVHASVAIFGQLRGLFKDRSHAAPISKPNTGEVAIVRNNVEESMHDAIDHGPMRKVPTLVYREAARYARRFDVRMMPMPQAA